MSRDSKGAGRGGHHGRPSAARHGPAAPARSPGAELHQGCFACGLLNRQGLHLAFEQTTDTEVAAVFDCAGRFEGYPGVVHGGIVSLLLDSAMTHCLFAQGRTSMTAELTVRFRKPVRSNRSAVIRAQVKRSSPRLQVLSAELIQDGETKAVGHGKFMAVAAEPAPRM